MILNGFLLGYWYVQHRPLSKIVGDGTRDMNSSKCRLLVGKEGRRFLSKSSLECYQLHALYMGSASKVSETLHQW